MTKLSENGIAEGRGMEYFNMEMEWKLERMICLNMEMEGGRKPCFGGNKQMEMDYLMEMMAE